MKIGWVGAGVLATAALVTAPRDAQAGIRLGVGVVFVSHDYGYGYGSGDAFRLGQNRGYDDGYEHGAKDAHHNEDYDFWHDRRYRCGDAGYKHWYGQKGEYVTGYRRGYEQGYRRAYSARYGYSRPDRYGYDNRQDDRDRYDRDRDGNDRDDRSYEYKRDR